MQWQLKLPAHKQGKLDFGRGLILEFSFIAVYEFSYGVFAFKPAICCS